MKAEKTKIEEVKKAEISVEEAKAAIETEKAKRGDEFLKAYLELCKKFNCEVISSVNVKVY